PGPQISVYSGIPDRQTVQVRGRGHPRVGGHRGARGHISSPKVIQQALHRQPNTAAQYLQQMYAAQQQHLMLQTAALQQQHLTSAQLQSLAAVQQVRAPRGHGGWLGAGTALTLSSSPRQAWRQTGKATGSPIILPLPHLPPLVGPGASGIAQQAVLLGNTASPALTASQAQMYLRAQMV
ncbi:PHC2 protein, partial [Nesospiza acunhae]|nr:PHC2 protein [Nesospiza acunhae]